MKYYHNTYNEHTRITLMCVFCEMGRYYILHAYLDITDRNIVRPRAGPEIHPSGIVMRLGNENKTKKTFRKTYKFDIKQR